MCTEGSIVNKRFGLSLECKAGQVHWTQTSPALYVTHNAVLVMYSLLASHRLTAVERNTRDMHAVLLVVSDINHKEVAVLDGATAL